MVVDAPHILAVDVDDVMGAAGAREGSVAHDPEGCSFFCGLLQFAADCVTLKDPGQIHQ